MEYGLIVTILCLSVVFGMLIMLVGALYLMRFLSVRTKKQDTDNLETEETVEEVEDTRIIAAITAAVNIMMHSKSQEKKARFVVRSIKRI